MSGWAVAAIAGGLFGASVLWYVLVVWGLCQNEGDNRR